MKNLFVICFILNCIISTRAQLTYVPDDAFELYIETYISGASNGNASDNYVNTNAIQIELGLNISGSVIPSGIINDFTGLEAFTSLHTMVIQYMNMTNVDLSNLFIVSDGGIFDFQLSISNCNLLENLVLPQGGGLVINIADCISLKNIVFHPSNILQGQIGIGNCPSLNAFDISMVSFVELQSSILISGNSALQCINLKNGFCSNWNFVWITGNLLVTCIQVDNPEYCYTASGTIWNVDPNMTYSSNCNCLVGIDEIETSDISLSPNPSSDKVSIKITEKLLYKKFTLIDQFGRIVLESCFEFQDNQLDLRQFNSGIYFLKIEGNEKIIKVLKA